jgi:hypothetical protein
MPSQENAMANTSTQSFIVTGSLDSFERDIDLADERAHEKITTLSKKFRALFKEMHERADELATPNTSAATSV